MTDHVATSETVTTSDFREGSGRTSIVAIFLGIGIIVASILLGRSYAFFVSFLIFSILLTMLWKKYPRPWIFLISISAATPIAVSRQNFACNLIFALWFVLFNTRYLFRLPRWIYVPTFLTILGILTSSINWISTDVVRSIMQQGAYSFNFFFGPFLLLPVAYLRLSGSKDHTANLQCLLFCLIIPSTLLLISSKLFGTVANAWEASLHVGSLSEGFLQYQLGKVIVSFLRTEVGFLLAAMICASTAVTISQVKGLYRLIAGVCLASNAFLLLATGSFGSGFACLCGLTAIYYMQLRMVSAIKVLISLVVIYCMIFSIYSFSPSNIKEYLGKRYEHRVTKADTDRVELWVLAVEHFLQNPEGVGMTLTVGDKVKAYIHNDYLVYAVSYGFFCGLAYVSLIVGLLISFFQVRKSIVNDPSALAVHLAGLGVIVAIAVNSITDHMNSNKWYFNVIWSVIWHSYFCCRTIQKGKRSEVRL